MSSKTETKRQKMMVLEKNKNMLGVGQVVDGGCPTEFMMM
jgi:hypothetical protein